jgi:hypothetical protein
VFRETSFGHPGIDGRVHLPQAYRRLPRPSSLIKPSHPPIGVFAPVPVIIFNYKSSLLIDSSTILVIIITHITHDFIRMTNTITVFFLILPTTITNI